MVDEDTGSGAAIAADLESVVWANAAQLAARKLKISTLPRKLYSIPNIYLKSAKGALDTATVLRVFFKRPINF